MIERYLDLLRRKELLRSPLSGSSLREWRDQLGVALPASLVRIYEVTDGSAWDEDLPMWLMRASEVVKVTDAFSDDLARAGTDPLLTFWDDGNSNHAVVFVEGPLVGMVGFLDHEETWPLPEYSCVESFLEVLVCGGEGWHDMKREYPRSAPAPSKLVERELDLKRIYLDRYRADEEDRWSALVLAQFLGPNDLEIVRELMSSQEMWVQERGCQRAGQMRMNDLTPELEQVALHGTHNGRLASLHALRRLGTNPAREALARLKKMLPPEFEIYFR